MYTFESRVRYSECASDARLSRLGLVNYLQDCSCFQSESLGIGIEDMKRNHYAWFLSAWQIEIEDLPRFNTPIAVSTWCYGVKRLLASRNFTIAGQDGTPYVRADSLWFLYDTKLGRPVKFPKSQMAYLEDTPRLDMPPTRRKIDVEGDFACAPSITVTRQHLDTNGHVNNAQYIQMALDAIEQTGQALVPWRITVQYESMALLHDTVEPQVFCSEGGRTVRLARPDGKPYAIVRIEVRS
ncbi:acyl-ACP thioesterase domain-containing protein [Parafannyhessea umbonata]|jgi:acyl-ACP thioesterase|uniref:acyl-[acyl-carrier-protein] thioesterase n=1 Tax=Parafannyhessea umbonata TaxID=604330 RepID=UPI00156A65B0|nr:thioesterase [Parafannyhessea umbonata]